MLTNQRSSSTEAPQHDARQCRERPLAVGWDGIAKTASKHIDGRKMCCVIVCSWHPWHHFLARRVLHKVWLVFDDRRYTPCACMCMVWYNDSSYWFVARKCR